MNIIEKLGIKPYKDVCLGLREYEGVKIEKQRNEMLMGLIDSCKMFEWYTDIHYKKYGVDSEKYARNKLQADYLKGIIEKATNKTWEEIKELIG